MPLGCVAFGLPAVFWFGKIQVQGKWGGKIAHFVCGQRHATFWSWCSLSWRSCCERFPCFESLPLAPSYSSCASRKQLTALPCNFKCFQRRGNLWGWEYRVSTFWFVFPFTFSEFRYDGEILPGVRCSSFNICMHLLIHWIIISPKKFWICIELDIFGFYCNFMSKITWISSTCSKRDLYKTGCLKSSRMGLCGQHTNVPCVYEF